MTGNSFYSHKFQKEFYDKLGKEKIRGKALFSCGYEERYDSKLIIDNEYACNLFNDLFSHFLTKGNNEVVLDLCTGSGIHLPLLSRYGKIILGADLSFGLLQRAQELKRELVLQNTFLFQVQAESIPLKNDVCDVIIIIDAIHHVEHQHQVMEELRRIARHNASFFMIEPNILNPLVFLAHRIPKEERGALRVNTVNGLTRLLRPYLDEISIKPFNYIASRKSSLFGRVVSRFIERVFDSIFPFWPIRLLVQGTFSKEIIRDRV